MGVKAISGIVVRGFGEGAYFMSMQHYRKEIKKKLGFDAYQGTLNIKVAKKQIDSFKKNPLIKIGGFKSRDKTFGGVNCYRARIKSVNGSIIIPEINKHKKDIIEFIASVHVKSELKIKNGDKIKIELI